MRHEKAHSDDESDSDLNIAAPELSGSSGATTPPMSRHHAVPDSDDDAFAALSDAEAAEASRTTGPKPEKKNSRKPVVAWRDLPRKKQLVLITVARLSEPITQTSLQAYLFYQLKWFDPSLPDSTISSQAGVMHAAFMAAQLVTAMLWGRISETRGRKSVLLVGLLGTCLSSLGFGFSTKYWQALICRTVGGALNGNIGVLRTMISEIIREKKYQSRAFILLPMTFNIGIVVGPILGGVLSDPAGSYPNVFGDVAFFKTFPYAVPNIVSALFLLGATAAVWLGLEETLDEKRDMPDFGLELGNKLGAIFRGKGRQRQDEAEYSALPSTDTDIEMTEERLTKPSPPRTRKRFTQHLPFRRIFTRNVTFTLVMQFFLTFHIGTFNALWFVFLSTPVWDPKQSDYKTRLPFHFTGGVGLQPKEVGMSLAILGVIGIGMQLLLYPRISARLGTIRSLRFFLLCFPFTYFLVPYLSIVPSTTAPPSQKTGPAIWMAIFGVLFIQVTGRTFALPSQIILVNNCSPHPSVLGTVHGLGQSVSSGAKTIGPMLGGWVYGYGLRTGVVGFWWWILSADAVVCCLVSLLLRDGDGHEIWLEGDEEDEPEGDSRRA